MSFHTITKKIRCASFLVFVSLILCCNSVDSRDEKLHNAIFEQMARGLDKNKLQQLDNVKILGVDSLTEKALYFIEIRRIEERIKDYISTIKYVEESNDYKMSNEYDGKWANDDKEGIINYHGKLKSLEKTRDSMNALHEKADGEKFKWFWVQADIAYTNVEKDTLSYQLLIDRDYRLKDTSISIANLLRDIEEFERLKKP